MAKYPEDKFNYQPGELIFISPCAACYYKAKNGVVCLAFPWGIPKEILLGKNKHTEIHPDQLGEIVFTPRKPIK